MRKNTTGTRFFGGVLPFILVTVKFTYTVEENIFNMGFDSSHFNTNNPFVYILCFADQ